MRLSTRLLLAASAAGALLLGAPVASAETAPPDPNLAQVVEEDEVVGDSLAEASAGHIDVGPKIIDGRWRMMARDDTATPPVWRDPSDFVIRVNDHALLEVPDDPQFAFMDLPEGKPVHVIPQTENRSSVWLGWNTQDPAVVPLLARGAELVLRSVDGPGEVFVFLSNGFDPPTELWNSVTLGEGEQAIWIEGNTHVHANWVFTEPGAYLVTAELRTADGNPEVHADTATLLLAVGDGTRTDDVLALAAMAETPAVSPNPTDTQSAPSVDGSPSSSPEDSDAAAPEPGLPVLGIGVGAGVAIIVLGGAGLLVARRSSRMSAEARPEEER
ncbi:MAG TPA: choice-of-anchor M domain-containing protein [Arachnia sp.]|nr:choice-of-anchor M domain-containing protein [Arachnia sp.]HMT87075.1 choice-of-anchor M domain-containing protein [Arachnia sp.]